CKARGPEGPPRPRREALEPMDAVRLAVGDQPDAELIARASAALLDNQIALLPAEGVYGFHARASSSAAVERIRALKGDPRAGFIGLIAAPGELDPRAQRR